MNTGSWTSNPMFLIQHPNDKNYFQEPVLQYHKILTCKQTTQSSFNKKGSYSRLLDSSWNLLQDQKVRLRGLTHNQEQCPKPMMRVPPCPECSEFHHWGLQHWSPQLWHVPKEWIPHTKASSSSRWKFISTDLNSTPTKCATVGWKWIHFSC